MEKVQTSSQKNGRNQLLLNNISTRAGYLIYGVVYSDLCWDRIHENYRKFKEKQLLAVKDQNIHTLAKLEVGMIEKIIKKNFPN